MTKYLVESLGSSTATLDAKSVSASPEWILFYDADGDVLAAFPTAQVFRVIPG
jgi:hypothetical protein